MVDGFLELGGPECVHTLVELVARLKAIAPTCNHCQQQHPGDRGEPEASHENPSVDPPWRVVSLALFDCFRHQPDVLNAGSFGDVDDLHDITESQRRVALHEDDVVAAVLEN